MEQTPSTTHDHHQNQNHNHQIVPEQIGSANQASTQAFNQAPNQANICPGNNSNTLVGPPPYPPPPHLLPQNQNQYQPPQTQPPAPPQSSPPTLPPSSAAHSAAAAPPPPPAPTQIQNQEQDHQITTTHSQESEHSKEHVDTKQNSPLSKFKQKQKLGAGKAYTEQKKKKLVGTTAVKYSLEWVMGLFDGN